MACIFRPRDSQVQIICLESVNVAVLLLTPDKLRNGSNILKIMLSAALILT